MDKCMLTTVDNPYDPFTQFDEWYAYDEQNGYQSCGLLARLATTSDKLTEEQNDKILDDTMNDIVKLFPGLYKKVNPKEGSMVNQTVGGYP